MKKVTALTEFLGDHRTISPVPKPSSPGDMLARLHQTTEGLLVEIDVARLRLRNHPACISTSSAKAMKADALQVLELANQILGRVEYQAEEGNSHR